MKKIKPKIIEKNVTSIPLSHSDMEENMIRARLALPANKRTGFLRKRLKNGGSFI